MATTVNDRIIELLADKAELPVEELGLDQTLEEIGLDSLHLMEVALWAQREYGADIPEGDLHHELTVREALAYLDEKTAAVR
jgi:acyl carrier protein